MFTSTIFDIRGTYTLFVPTANLARFHFVMPEFCVPTHREVASRGKIERDVHHVHTRSRLVSGCLGKSVQPTLHYTRKL